MKTAVFFLSPSCGGAERMTITIAKLLDRKEYDVRFVVIGQKIGEIKEFIPKDYPLDLVKIRNISDFTTLRVYRFLKKVKPQYVFCSLHYLNPRVILAAHWVGNCIIAIRFNCAVDNITGITKFLTEKTYPKADVIIAQTERMQLDLEKTYPHIKNKVVTMHNLIDTDTISEKLKASDNPYKNDNNKIFVWVGRFSNEKGTDTVVKAFIEACKLKECISLYLVGKINEQSLYYKEVKKLVESSGLKEKIHMVGFQDNPYKWMKNADCFVLSSVTEGSPNALFEALYLGTPAVATRCTPNIDSIIVDGKNGYKVGVGDYAAMAEAMIKALEVKDVKVLYNHSTKEDFIKLFKQ